MTPSWQIGPVALPFPLLLTLAAVALGWFVGKRLGRSAGIDAEPLLLRMLLVGMIGARLGFVWQWRAAYFAEPLTMLDIRDGGFEATAGVAIAALYGMYRVRRHGAPRAPVVAALLTTGIVWTLGSFALAVNTRPVVPLPTISLPAVGGPAVTLSEFVGKPTVINLWATWCPPCQREMPLLQNAQQANAAVNFVFVNQGESPEVVAGYLNRHALKLDNVLVDTRLQVGSYVGQHALPVTLFFDARGQLVSSRIGELSTATLEQRLIELRPPIPAAR